MREPGTTVLLVTHRVAPAYSLALLSGVDRNSWTRSGST